jgi:acyl-CoA thioester hydrolase
VTDTGMTTEHGLLVAEGTVEPEWTDLNGHMNVAYYLLAFDKGVDALWTRAGITDEYIAERKRSTFAVEAHVTYQRELHEGDRYRVTSQILAIDDKRLHQFQRLYHAKEGFLAATGEWLNLHVNLETRRVCPWPDDILRGFTDIAESQSDKVISQEVGKRMNIPRPLFSLGGYSARE